MKNISRRDFVKQSMFAGSALYFSTLPINLIGKNKFNNPDKKPNLLFVFPDQMRAQTLGFMNEDPVLTPNLDKFSKESVVLKEAVSNYPVCSPFRAMMLTGQYPHTNGVTLNCNSKSAQFNNELKESSKCWSDVLKEKDYNLGYIGKWHLDAPQEPYVKSYNNEGEKAWNEWCPPNRRHGFDYWNSYGTYDRHLNPMYWDTDAKRDEAHWVNKWGPEHETDLALEYIENKEEKFRNSENPFALVVSMNPPHSPYTEVPKKYLDIYKDKDVEELCNRENIPPAGTKWGDFYRKNIKGYFAMVSGVDEQFGRIMDALDASGQAENTIVVFTSDHGDCLGIHDEVSKNNPYEESMRIPFMIRYPGKIKSRTDDLLISSPDIYPTLLELMGYKDSIPQEVEGTSYANILLNGKGERASSQLYLYMDYGEPEFGKRGVRTKKYTFVISMTPNKTITKELYDREVDPFQLNNIVNENSKIVEDLYKNELTYWLKKNNDPWLKNYESMSD